MAMPQKSEAHQDIGGTTTTGTVIAKENAILTKLNKIGNTNETGATSIAGTAMGKLNYLIEDKPYIK